MGRLLRRLVHLILDFLHRLRGARHRDALDQRLTDEMRFHVEMATERNLQTGMSPADARRAALVAFGGTELWKEQARDEYHFRAFDEFVHDVRQGVRGLRRAPGFTIAAVTTLALSIGATTAIFSVVNAVLLRALPYPQSGRVLVLCEHNVVQPDAPRCNTINPGNFLAWRDGAASFSAVAAFFEVRTSVAGGGGEPVAVRARIASPSGFTILGARPAAGRLFTEGDDRADAPDVVVLSHEFWRSHFGGDPGLVGTTILIDARAFTIIGVLAPGFGLYEPVDLWIPLRHTPDSRSSGGRFLRAIGRLQDGVSQAQADRELETIATTRAADLPAINANWTALTMPLREYLTGSSQRSLWVLFGTVGFLLLIACANITNLLLARAVDREREVAVRISLGASPGRILRQLLTENLVLSVVSAAIGFGLAAVGTGALLGLVPVGVLALSQAPIAIDWTVAGFTAAIALGAALLFALVPAWSSASTQVQETLREGGRGASNLSRSGIRLRNALVVVEIALAVVLLAGAGLMVRTFTALNRVSLGFDPSPVLTSRIVLPTRRYPSDTARRQFFRAASERIAAIPGVTAVGFISYLPLTGQRASNGFNVEGQPVAPLGAEPVGDMRAVTPGYFAAMEIPLQEGRIFSDHDTETSPSVAVVGAALARRFWPGESAVGHYLLYEWYGQERVEIVGVVGDVLDDGPAAMPFLEIYRPLTQFPYPAMGLAARVTGDPGSYQDLVRDGIRELDADLPLADPQPMDALVRRALSTTRLSTTLFLLFGALGLGLATVGIYGVMSYTVQQRRHEFGVRMALGGPPGALVAMVVRRGAQLALIGILIGATLAFLTTQLMSKLLFDVKPGDRATFAIVAVLLLAVGTLAAYLPGRRAARTDLVALMRGE